VAIKASASREIDALITDLTGLHPTAREAAVARLTVIGARAVERLLDVIRSSSDPVARAAAVRTLEGIRDPRGLRPALEIASSAGDTSLAVAAVGLARIFIRSDRGRDVVDRLTKLALDVDRPVAVRLAAIAALKDLEPATVEPLLRALARDASAAIRGEAGGPGVVKRPDGTQTIHSVDPDAFLMSAAQEALPDNPDQLRAALAGASRKTPLSVLLKIVERAREKEVAEPRRRDKWATVRGAGHRALAKRRSRIGVYDLREWLDTSTSPLPVDAFAALSLLGDVSCLEPIAARYAAPTDEWSTTHLAELFRAIVSRERISRRHPIVKRIGRKYAAALAELWPNGDRPRKSPPTR
jgi:hypothetical protein